MRRGNNYSGARWAFSSQPRPRKPKRTVTYDGKTYKVRKDSIEIPDLKAMPRIAALAWLNSETYATGRGTRTKPNPLAGLGDAISLEVR